jgi:alpha-ketoglutarate-dependent taurine dioxygenase
VKQTGFTTRELTPSIGTEILTDADTLAGGGQASEIRRLLQQHCVLCFRDVHLSEAQQVAFARTLGTISDESPDGIFIVAAGGNSNRRLADYQRGSFYWHFDGFERSTPFLATMLNPRALSAIGGDTEIANLCAAYEDLPAAEQDYLQTLRVVHCFEAIMRVVTSWPSYAELSEWRQRPEKSHPLVWTHRSGRKSLVIGSSASHIEGLGFGEGRALLLRLCEWATQPRYLYRHQWRLGDLVIWDNTSTLHRAIPYPLDSGRLMLRTTLAGEESVA